MPFPEFNTNTSAYLCRKQWFNFLRSTNQCMPNENKKSIVDRLSSYSYKRIILISEKYENFIPLDFLPEFCVDGICNPIHKESKNYLYIDPNHIEAKGSLELYNSFMKQLNLKFRESELLNY